MVVTRILLFRLMARSVLGLRDLGQMVASVAVRLLVLKCTIVQTGIGTSGPSCTLGTSRRPDHTVSTAPLLGSSSDLNR
ncbi:hypothetical protein L917_02811 [Phytophthora nicotianae]|uniref:Secreted protein n=1 Tax=Phytophthora nicotianae TaxID=4792 RepID=W2LSM8_PHYNI|nr:hypothetical protein L917_02811 [Phytophthora nicotianae]